MQCYRFLGWVCVVCCFGWFILWVLSLFARFVLLRVGSLVVMCVLDLALRVGW